MLPGLPLSGHMPAIDFFLKLVANSEQFTIQRREFSTNGLNSTPERGRVASNSWQKFGLHKLMEYRIYAEPAGHYSIIVCHSFNCCCSFE